MEMDVRIKFTQFFYDFSNLMHCPGFSAADIDVPAYGVFRGSKLGFCFIHHRDDLFCPLPKPHAIAGEAYIVAFSDQKLYAQFFLQILDLSGQGRLCQMEKVGGGGDISLTGNGEKIAEYTDFHRIINSFRWNTDHDG